MPFWSRKKKDDTAAPPSPAPALLSVFLSGGRFDEDILSTLPRDTQVTGREANADKFPLLRFSEEPTGKYYLFADADCRPATEAGAFYAQLEEREEELLLFSLRKEDVLPPFPQDVPSFFMQERFPLARAGFAVSAALYRRAAALCTPATALDLLLCAESAASVPSPLFKADPLPWNEEQVLGSVRFFNAAKAGMDAEKYRYAFSFLRERITGVYAALCAQGDRSALCTFDEALKRECPALRVAAFRSAPLQFLSILQKKNFERGLLASAGAKLALFSEKRQ